MLYSNVFADNRMSTSNSYVIELILPLIGGMSMCRVQAMPRNQMYLCLINGKALRRTQRYHNSSDRYVNDYRQRGENVDVRAG